MPQHPSISGYERQQSSRSSTPRLPIQNQSDSPAPQPGSIKRGPPLLPTQHSQPKSSLASTATKLRWRTKNLRERIKRFMLRRVQLQARSRVDGNEGLTSSQFSKNTAQCIQDVINTFELLEQILLHLPLTELLRFQAIDSRLQQTILKSLPLQRALFLEPLKDRNRIEPYYSNSHEDPGWYYDQMNSQSSPLDTIFDDGGSMDRAVIYHPLLARKFDRIFKLYRHDDGVPEEVKDMRESDASWRQMFICQPPLTSIGIHNWQEDGIIKLAFSTHAMNTQRTKILHKRQGLKFGDLLAGVRQYEQNSERQQLPTKVYMDFCGRGMLNVMQPNCETTAIKLLRLMDVQGEVAMRKSKREEQRLRPFREEYRINGRISIVRVSAARTTPFR